MLYFVLILCCKYNTLLKYKTNKIILYFNIFA
nr:MAG TPA: hypothetical protein [Caudoviricetes sp.]